MDVRCCMFGDETAHSPPATAFDTWKSDRTHTSVIFPRLSILSGKWGKVTWDVITDLLPHLTEGEVEKERRSNSQTSPSESLKKLLGKQKVRVTIEQLNAAITAICQQIVIHIEEAVHLAELNPGESSPPVERSYPYTTPPTNRQNRAPECTPP